jgi:hypothetical protein
MNKWILLIGVILLVGCIQHKLPETTARKNKVPEVQVKNTGNVDFATYFSNKTMRVDYFHSGNAVEEHFAVSQILNDGSWGGSTKVLTDDLGLGAYFFEIADTTSGTLLYSRGFSSIFGEWQTTPEAKEQWGTFPESVRFPWPKKPVTLILKKRDSDNKFQTIWTTVIDPLSRKVNPAPPEMTYKTDIIHESGPAQQKLDIVILGDGYTSSEMGKFVNDTKRLTDILLKTEPFKSRKDDINIRAVETPSEVTGITKPHHGIFKRSPLSTHYSSFDSERYILTYDNKTVRNVASEVPYDFMIILVNEKTYGGGGIYNLYTTVAVDNTFSGYIMVHELGHHIGALADEYYTSSVSYEKTEITTEPWEPNITALLDKDNLKWKDLVAEGTPIPTPWEKAKFDSYEYQVQKERDSLRAIHAPESVLEKLFKNELVQEDEFFNIEPYRNKVGAFEGAGYMQYGLYRPQLDCIMFTRHMQFCKVCQRSLNNVIDQYTH